MEEARARRRGVKRVVTKEEKARWTKSHKFVRLGIAEGKFNELLAVQRYACAMCLKPFEGERPQVDHDHSCCPRRDKKPTRTCGKCIRGLLCFRCNTALGYYERYGIRAEIYLAGVPDRMRGIIMAD